MINLIRSEVLKIRSTQVWFWMLLLAGAFTALGTIGNVVGAVQDHNDGNPVDYYSVFTQSGGAGVALLVLGLLGLTTEFRHKTITPTLLATPNRWRLLAGKAASYAVFAVVYALFCVVLNFAIAIIWLSAENVPLDYGHGVPGGVGKALLTLVLTGMFGLGLGALLRNQAAAMVFGIVYFFVLDPLLSVVPWIRKGYAWTPGGAVKAFNSNGTVDGPFDDVHLLAPAVGGLLFLAWSLALLAIGGRISLSRDIS
ncbi:MAG: ABC transporter permease subunit [Actinobacteria bacterium]|nr:ABC transporter permease subunit [Actinomycetota bacterium]